MGQENEVRKFWTLTNLFMVKDAKEFKRWVNEIAEAYVNDIRISIREDKEMPAKLNELASLVNLMEDRKYLLRPADAVFYGLYIEGEAPTVRMKTVRELWDEGETETEEPEVRDIDFLEELSTHLYEGEVALVTTVGVQPETFITAKGFIVTSDGATICPVGLPAALFDLAGSNSKFAISKLPEH